MGRSRIILRPSSSSSSSSTTVGSTLVGTLHSSTSSSESDHTPSPAQPSIHHPSTHPLPIKRMRSSNSMRRHCLRKFRDISGWSGGLKVLLFLALAVTVWITVFILSKHDGDSTTSSASSSYKGGAKKSSSSHATSGLSVDSKRAVTTKSFAASEPPTVTPRVVANYPHDSDAFTQGLLVHDGYLWESTGLYGRSELRRVELSSGQVIESVPLPREVFGEGLTLMNEKLYQITWREQKGYVYDVNSITQGPTQTWSYPMEGWGLTHNSTHLLLSDGSSTLYWFDPTSLAVVGSLNVRWYRHGRLQSVPRLNELEWIDGVIYANVWMTNKIILIRPSTGLVEKVIDARSLHPNPSNPEMSLNGIAWDHLERKLYITGKLWPKMYEISYVGLD